MRGNGTWATHRFCRSFVPSQAACALAISCRDHRSSWLPPLHEDNLHHFCQPSPPWPAKLSSLLYPLAALSLLQELPLLPLWCARLCLAYQSIITVSRQHSSPATVDGLCSSFQGSRTIPPTAEARLARAARSAVSSLHAALYWYCLRSCPVCPLLLCKAGSKRPEPEPLGRASRLSLPAVFTGQLINEKHDTDFKPPGNTFAKTTYTNCSSLHLRTLTSYLPSESSARDMRIVMTCFSVPV